MMRGGKTAICCAISGLLLASGAKANVPDAHGSPYQGIVDRNVFGLKPPPPPPRPEDIKPPIPDINLTGITTILGNKRALLKVPAKPPKQPKEESYILTEGQRDGDIEVLNIDEVAGTVKVNNHGTVQTLDFVNNGIKAPGGSAPGPVGAAPLPPGNIPPMNHPGAPGGGFRQIPARPLRPSPEAGSGSASAGGVPSAPPAYAGAPNPANNPGTMNVTLGGAPSTSMRLEDSPQFTHGLTGDEQTLLIEAQRAKLLDEGNIEDANMYPITDLTPELTQGHSPATRNPGLYPQ